MSPLPGDMSCNLVCTLHNNEDKRWIIMHPYLRGLFCQKYFSRDKYELLKANCFWTCRRGKNIKCPSSNLCLAIGKPYFELKEEYL